MYRVLLLSETNSASADFAKAYFNKFAGNRVEIFSASIELGKRDEIVNELLDEDSVNLADDSLHTAKDFQSVEFDFILTLDELSENESHHFSSHIIKYHFDYTELLPGNSSGKEKHAAYVKLRDKVKEDMHAFVQEHIPKKA